jgi:hypothetical protein
MWNCKGVYNPELMEQPSKYKRRFKSLRSRMESLLNQSHNKYNQDTICIENCEESDSLWKVNLLYIFSLNSLETTQKRWLKSQSYICPKYLLIYYHLHDCFLCVSIGSLLYFCISAHILGLKVFYNSQLFMHVI